MKPKLRAVEVIPFQQDGEEFLLLRDGLGLSPDVALSSAFAPLLSLFDGTRTITQIIDEYAARGGERLPLSFVEKVVDDLDENLLLHSSRFEAARRQMLRLFNDSAVRPAAFAGQAYPDDPVRLRALLHGFFDKARQLPIDNPQTPEGRLRAVVVPHIDFTRGGPVEALAYAPLQDEPPFDVFVILGIAHCGVRYPFCAAAKSYDTPLGAAQVDAGFVEALQSRVGPRLTAEQFAHKNEHSIEFVAVFLQGMEQTRGARIVPILCGGFHDETRTKRSPGDNRDIAGFIAALREVTREWESRGQRVGFIASVDGAHIGSRFGDEARLTPARLQQTERADREFWSTVEAGDAEAMHRHIARDNNARNVDAHPALYTLLTAFPDLRGQLLHYAQAFDAAANSVVSFASLLLHEA